MNPQYAPRGGKSADYSQERRVSIFQHYQKHKSVKRLRDIAEELEIDPQVLSRAKKSVWWKEMEEAQ